MKTAKKILSVVLAVILVLGTVVVAANAAVPASAKIVSSFKIEVLDPSEGCENIATEVKNGGREFGASGSATTTLQKADIAAYKELEEHNYADTTKPVEVKAGQVVWLTVNIKHNDFYLGGIETTVFYSVGKDADNTTLFSGTLSGAAQTVNCDSEWNEWGFTNTVTYWSKIIATKRTSFTKLLADPSAYHCVSVTSLHSAYDEVEGILVPDADIDLVTFPLFVSPDAKVGDTVTLDYYLGKKPDYAQFADGDVTGDIESMPLSQMSTVPVTLVVVDDVAELDYTELDAQIAAFDALKEADYTADTWAEAKEYYDAAVAAKTDAETQDEVDEAAGNLADAIENLEKAPVLSFDALEKALEDAAKVDKDTLTTSSAADLDAAVAAAEAAKSATTQEEINKATADLCDVLDNLSTKADLTALNNALAEAAEVDKDKYTADTVKALEDAVAAGQAIVANADETSDTAAVAKATNDINTAISGLKLKGADYTAVDTAESTIAGLKEADYTAASWAKLKEAEKAVVRGYDIEKQAAVDAMATALNNAIDGLKKVADTSALEEAIAAAADADKTAYAADVWEAIQNDVALANTYVGAGLAADDVQNDIDALTAKINSELANTMGAADYSKVDAALEKIPADLSGYTDASVAALNNAVNAVARGLMEDKQASVDKMAADIEAAINNLEVKKADYTALNAAIANADAKVGDEALYTAETYSAYKTAYDAAKAVPAGQDYTAQDSIDAAAKALNDAVDGLAYAGADWTALDAAVEKVNGVDRSLYTDDSLAKMDAAAATALEMYNAKSDYDINSQSVIDAAAEKADGSLKLLVLKDADYAKVDAAKEEAAAITRSHYTSDSLAALDAALAAVPKNAKIDKQADVDAAADAISEAVKALVLKDADYSSVDSQITRAGKLSAKDYTKDSWAALEAAIDAVVRGYKADKQADVDNMAIAIEKAINALVKVSGADYSEILALNEQYQQLNPNLYTDETYDAYEAAINAVDYSLSSNDQDKVDAMAKAIKDAYAALELKDADYTAVNTAKDNFAAMDTANYTDDSVKAVEDAIAAVVEGKKIDEQTAVDDMAKAINDAIDALELKDADYTAVNEAIAKFDALDKSIYTGASVRNVEKAIAAVVEGKKIDEQADVDAMAQAINDAIAALKEPAGVVTNVVVAESPTNTKDLTITVENRAFKVQLIDENGNTVTKSRVDHPEYITSYDKDGNVVDYMSRDIAYEEWNFTATLKPGKYTVISRDSQDGWETKDLGYEVVIENSVKYIDVVSLTPSAGTAKVSTELPLTVVTGKDITKIQILVDDATEGAKTFYASSSGTIEGDQCTYNIYVKLYSKGDHTLKVKYRTAEGWEVCDDVTATVTAVK
ncbi:MAG: hypothetical protein MJ147_03775 [Clostridia bacterium]|nr:hypothetical protein [Clostridia bacterium]